MAIVRSGDQFFGSIGILLECGADFCYQYSGATCAGRLYRTIE